MFGNVNLLCRLLDGPLNNLEKAREFENCKVVNPCWTDECARISGVADPKQFPTI